VKVETKTDPMSQRGARLKTGEINAVAAGSGDGGYYDDDDDYSNSMLLFLMQCGHY